MTAINITISKVFQLVRLLVVFNSVFKREGWQNLKALANLSQLSNLKKRRIING